MIDRMIRAARLDSTLFREIANNPETMTEAVTVAVITAAIPALSAFFAQQSDVLQYGLQLVNNLLFGWVLWAVIANLTGSRFLGGRSNLPGLLRALAFASVPRILSLLGFIMCIGWIFSLIGWVWSIAAGVLAIREAMETDSSSALITAILGFMLYVAVSVVIGLFLAPTSFLGSGY